jgi:hypothetical protein
VTPDQRIAWILSYPKEARKLLLFLCEGKLDKRHIVASIDRKIAEAERPAVRQRKKVGPLTECDMDEDEGL